MIQLSSESNANGSDARARSPRLRRASRRRRPGRRAARRRAPSRGRRGRVDPRTPRTTSLEDLEPGPDHPASTCRGTSVLSATLVSVARHPRPRERSPTRSPATAADSRVTSRSASDTGRSTTSSDRISGRAPAPAAGGHRVSARSRAGPSASHGTGTQGYPSSVGYSRWMTTPLPTNSCRAPADAGSLVS